MRNVTDPDRLRTSLIKSLSDTADFHKALTSFPEGNDETPIMNNTALISVLQGMAERISGLERRLDRAEKDIRKWKEFPDEVISKLANGVSPVKVFRKYRGMTQKEIAARAGCTITYISQIEQRNRSGSMKMLRRLANILDVDVRELVEP